MLTAKTENRTAKGVEMKTEPGRTRKDIPFEKLQKWAQVTSYVVSVLKESPLRPKELTNEINKRRKKPSHGFKKTSEDTVQRILDMLLYIGFIEQPYHEGKYHWK